MVKTATIFKWDTSFVLRAGPRFYLTGSVRRIGQEASIKLIQRFFAEPEEKAINEDVIGADGLYKSRVKEVR